MTTLPKKKSELLRLAVNDVLRCKEEPGKYILDMGTWYRKDGIELCHVCMAGAVMAQTLKMDPIIEQCSLDAIPRDIRPAIVLINNIRKGFGTGSAKADMLIQSNYNNKHGHAPWDIYLQAADIMEAEENEQTT